MFLYYIVTTYNLFVCFLFIYANAACTFYVNMLWQHCIVCSHANKAFLNLNLREREREREKGRGRERERERKRKRKRETSVPLCSTLLEMFRSRQERAN